MFAAYDCDWPPTLPDWRAEAAYNELMANVKRITQQRGIAADVKRWEKGQHLARMQASGCFQHTKEITVHHAERGNADRLVGIALSQGSIATLLKHGLSEEEIGLDELRIAARTLDTIPQPWYLSYRVRVGIR